MGTDKEVDPTQTYVLEETSITRLNSLEELAELALRQDEESRRRERCESEEVSRTSDAHPPRDREPNRR